MNACGPEHSRPVVLLHGHGCTSAVWFANVARLGRTHRVLAVDQMGDAGRSVPAGKVLDSPAHLMRWLDGVLDALGVTTAGLCGHSYGAWMALSYALHTPERVTHLALLDPTDCFAPMALTYRLRALPLFARPSAGRVRRFLTWESAGIPLDPAALALASLGGGAYQGDKIIMPRRPSTSVLRRLDVPTLLVLAADSKAHDIDRVEAGARATLPDLTVTRLDDASHHSIPASPAAQLNDALARFLAESAGPAATTGGRDSPGPGVTGGQTRRRDRPEAGGPHNHN